MSKAGKFATIGAKAGLVVGAIGGAIHGTFVAGPVGFILGAIGGAIGTAIGWAIIGGVIGAFVKDEDLRPSEPQVSNMQARTRGLQQDLSPSIAAGQDAGRWQAVETQRNATLTVQGTQR